jgi:hypothetical protein
MARGPVPNRSDDLSRPRERKGSDIVPVTKGVARPSTIPDSDPDWHPIAQQLWTALAASGQADFYQQSDWALAFSICEDLSHFKNSTKRSGQMLQTIYSAMERLLVAEGDRRRVRIELHEPEDEDATPAAVVAIESYRRELGVAP